MAPGRRLCGPHPQGREARGPADRAGDEARAGRQRTDRKDTRPHGAADAARRRRRGDRMRRREFITLLGAAAAWPLAARAALGSEASGQRDDSRVQGERRTRRIGVLMLYAENDTAGQVRATAFRQQLEKLQWEVGRNLQIDYYWGIGD